jgi:glutamate synthase domain-containing protein 3
MASISDSDLKKMTQDERVKALGMTSEQLTGRSMFMEFDADASDRFLYPWAPEVDFNKRIEIDSDQMTSTEVNEEIKKFMDQGYGTIVLKNPRGKHSIGVGILSKLNLIIEGSTGYFGVGLIDGPNVRITGRVGWSCGENMMSGTIVVEKNAGSTFGAAIRGGDLVCKGSVGSRTGIDMKGGSIIVGGDTGALSGFMMQRGRMVVCGNAGKNLGDSMYDGTIYIGGEIQTRALQLHQPPKTEFRLLYRWCHHTCYRPDSSQRSHKQPFSHAAS